jgi:cellulose synthase/poly-beta-1,6-N-acetylglucosamine synthase-like glycosyltransferase
MILIVIIIVLFYSILIGAFIYGFNTLETFKVHDNAPNTKFSIVIPFRNEAENLLDLIKSIKKLNYPSSHFEVLFIDDNSTDNSAEIISKNISDNWMILNNLKNTKSPKKDAINMAISHAKFNWIITTDADCIVPKNWLYTFNAFILKNECSLIAAPVKYYNLKTFLDYFQNLDFISLIGTTIGSFGINKPFMANGANLAYKKSFFNELDGFLDNSDIASGDDVFLLQKAINTKSEEVRFLKSETAIVSTKPQPSWDALISQRIRWASKSSSYKNIFSVITGFTILLMNVLIVATTILLILGFVKFYMFFSLLLLKVLIDFLLIYRTSIFLSHKISIPYFLTSSLIYPFFISYIFILSTFKSYDWKERTFYK